MGDVFELCSPGRIEVDSGILYYADVEYISALWYATLMLLSFSTYLEAQIPCGILICAVEVFPIATKFVL